MICLGRLYMPLFATPLFATKFFSLEVFIMWILMPCKNIQIFFYLRQIEDSEERKKIVPEIRRMNLL